MFLCAGRVYVTRNRKLIDLIFILIYIKITREKEREREFHFSI